MDRHRPGRRGVTLPELILALALAGALATVGVPPARRTLDRLAVLTARDEVASLFARTRAVAVARGGARLIVDVGASRLRVEAADGWRGPAVDLREELGVVLEVSGDRDLLAYRYDGLGIGRVASGTLRLRRNGEEATVRISSYGRVSGR